MQRAASDRYHRNPHQARAGGLNRIIIVNGGAAGGAFSIDDCTDCAMAFAANLIFTIGYGATIGTVITLDWPCASGIVLSSVPDRTSIIAVSCT